MALKFLNNGYFAGTVGIGTESPLKKLSINGGDVAVNNGNSFIVGAAITGNTQIGELGADSGQLQLLTESTRDIKFGSTTYGNIMFLEGSNGNVGIGVTNPLQKLHVNGSAYISNDFWTTGDTGLWFNNGSFTAGITGRSGGDEVGIFAGSSERIRIDDGGNVGIGTTSPDQKLQIEFANSDTSFSGGSGGDWGSEGIRIENTINTVNTMAMLHFRNNDADVHIASIRQGANDSDLGFFFEGSQKVRFKKDGNVGIGTITPSQKLQVAGNLRVTGAYYDSNNSPGTANQVLVSTVTGTDWIDGSAIPGVPAGSGTLNTIPLWTPDGDTLGNSVMTQSGANIGIGTTSYTNSSGYSTLNINGTSGGQIAFQTAGASKHFIWGTATDFNIYNGQAGPLILYTSATERIRITSAGNVGIGVTGPGDKLSIAGSLSTLHTGYTTKALRVTMNSNDTLLSLYARADQSNQQVLLRTNGNSYLNGGNVGIGTTSPSEKLEVSGSNTLSIKLSPNNTEATYVTTLTNNYSASLGTELKSGTYNILTHGNGTGTALNFTNGVMTFDYRNSEYMRITSAGNVGIGTTSPGYKLSVNGTIQSDLIRGYTYPDHSFLDFDYDQTAATNSTALTSIARVSYISDSNGNDPATSIGHSFMTGTTDIDTATPLLTILNNGNVGIGTTSPGAKLHVAYSNSSVYSPTSPSGDLVVSRHNTSSVDDQTVGIRFDTTGFAGTTTGQAAIQAIQPSNLSSADLAFLTRNNATFGERMRITSDGNVGIGTDNPLGKLHVYTASSGATANTNADDFIIESNTNAGISILGDGNETQYIMFGDVANSAIGRITYNHTDNNMSLYTNGSERMRIDSSGNVGIGTTSPDALLDIGVNNIITLDDTGSSTGFIGLGSYNDGTKNRAQGASYYGFGIEVDRPSQIMSMKSYDSNGAISGSNITLNRSGNVGIGNTDPQQKLHIVDTDGANIILNSNTGAENNGIWMTEGGVATPYVNGAYVHYDSTNNEFKINTGAASLATRFTIARDTGAIKFNSYNSTNQTGTPTYLLGTDASGNVVKTLTTPSPITSQAASLYDLIPNGAFTTTYAFTSTAGTYAKVMQGDDVITANGTYTVQMFVDDYAVGGTQYSETYSGIMSWGSSTNTNDTGGGTISEIVLHRSGHAANQGMTYLRTRETTSSEGSELRLEIMCNRTYTGASNVVFKFVRLI